MYSCRLAQIARVHSTIYLSTHLDGVHISNFFGGESIEPSAVSVGNKRVYMHQNLLNKTTYM